MAGFEVTLYGRFWVTREFENRWRAFERSVGGSWRADETYVSVGGKWMFLYRAVDEQGKTIESYLSRTRDKAAAKGSSGSL